MKRATHLVGRSAANGVISIHALVKRATKCLSFDIRIHYYFNPRPREEGDLAVNDSITEDKPNFNPRPREEGDKIGNCG